MSAPGAGIGGERRIIGDRKYIWDNDQKYWYAKDGDIMCACGNTKFAVSLVEMNGGIVDPNMVLCRCDCGWTATLP